jgi:hypothetical protein
MERSKGSKVRHFELLSNVAHIYSVLLRTVISKAPVGDKESDLMTPELFEKLGRLCFTQLLELRHRGAFSTVSQTFAVFCRRCVSSNIPSIRALPEMWYQVLMVSTFDNILSDTL